MNNRPGQRTLMTARFVACAVALVALFSVVCSLALAPASAAAEPPQVQPVAPVVQATAAAPAATGPCTTKNLEHVPQSTTCTRGADTQLLTGTLTSAGCPDAALEPDNTRGQARFLATGTTQAHAFCSAGDQDWVKFNATAGTTYVIKTLTGRTDTVLYLYAPDGTTLITRDDDGGDGLASLITFRPTASGTHLLMAHRFGGTGWHDQTYHLKLAATEPPPNLLHNASFEADTNGDTRPDAWSGNTKFTRSTTFAQAGTHAGRHRATDNSWHTITQTVTGLTAGASYALTGQVRIPASSDAFTYRLEIRWINASDATIRTDTVKTYRAATSGWNRASSTTAAPSTTTKAQVRLVAGSLNTTIYVDNLLFQRR